MAAVVDGDWSIATNGDIRYTGSGTTNTVIEFHRWLQDKADDAAASGDDLLDITNSTPSDRATDNIIQLLGGYNIDDRSAEYLFDGSIQQGSGSTEKIYSGLVVVGAVETGTVLDVIQDGKVLKNFWGTGINADAANNIISRMLIKTREDGVDIDGKRLRVQARKLSDTYAEFSLTAGLANSTAAIFTSDDLNNQTAAGTIEGWSTITNTEGLRLLDVDADTVSEEYYSEWNLGIQTINDLFERTKLIQRSAVEEDSNADTATDYTVGNGTLTGQAQSIAVGTLAKRITKARFRLKKFGTPTGSLTFTLYTITGTHGTSAIPNVLQAASETFDVSLLTTSYQEIELRFLGNQQFLMSGGTNYAIAVEYTGGDASNYVQVDGDATGTHGGNQSDETASVWTAAAAEDLWFELYASPDIHSMSGELFRGITHSFAYDNESGGPFVEDGILSWGTSFAYDNEASGPFTVGERLDFSVSGAVGRLIWLDDDGLTGKMVVQIESGTPADNNVITGFDSGATADVQGAVSDVGATAGTGQILALDDDGLTGNLYIQLLTGGAPVDNLPLYSGATPTTADVQGAVTSRTVSAEFIGQSTGSSIIGAYGIGIEPADLTASDKVFDLTNTLITPPNNVTFALSGLISGEDRVLVGPEDGASGLDIDQMTLSTTLNGAAETAVVVSAAIPTDTPSSGTIRIQLDSGLYRRQAYTSYTGSTFTIPSTDYTGANQATTPRNVYVSYIDKLAGAPSEQFTSVYLSDRTLFLRVRDGGATPIKTFESTGTLGSAGGSAVASRISDA
jgi:hypothetical protein